MIPPTIITADTIAPIPVEAAAASAPCLISFVAARVILAGLAALSKSLAPNALTALTALPGRTDSNFPVTFVIPSLSLANKAWIVEF